MSELTAADIILRPVVSEKSYALMADGKYTFRVDDRAHKTQIAKAIEEVFDVGVVAVRVILVRVGVYGNYWNIPADMVFELPEEIRDAYYGKGEVIYDETNIEEDLQIIAEEELSDADFLLHEQVSRAE